MEALLENTPLVGGLGLLLGLLIGMLIMRLVNGGGSSKAELQAKLEAVEAEYETHKESVNNHFETTSELVNDLTESYVKVYKHLSQGATNLSGAVDVSHRLTLDATSAAVVSTTAADPNSVVADEAIEETLTELEATARDLAEEPSDLSVEMPTEANPVVDESTSQADGSGESTPARSGGESEQHKAG